MAKDRQLTPKRRRPLSEELEPPFEEEPPHWRTLRGPKYGPPRRLTALDQLSSSDVKQVARLVKEYGADVIAEAAKLVSLPGKVGRPRNSERESFLERAYLAEWFDEVVKQHKKDGRRFPVKATLEDLFELQYLPEEKSFDKFEKTTKRKLPEARRALKQIKEEAVRYDAYMRKIKRGE